MSKDGESVRISWKVVTKTIFKYFRKFERHLLYRVTQNKRNYVKKKM